MSERYTSYIKFVGGHYKDLFRNTRCFKGLLGIAACSLCDGPPRLYHYIYYNQHTAVHIRRIASPSQTAGVPQQRAGYRQASQVAVLRIPALLGVPDARGQLPTQCERRELRRC